ncbi:MULTISPECIES: amino acid ABC transporter permease [Rhodomicrobium]|uniref:amino acid ABC transporter permease n=1 Tax=Rhodomicrobium TaxID=1068 RepID=UPI000B4A8946|nr:MULTISPECIES: amino acid ABC transporter permease [Rhodomicrobium]
MAESVVFQPIVSRPPPLSETGLWHWARERLFGSVTNSLVTLICIYILYLLIPPMLSWAVFNANISGTDRSVCAANPGGACWTFIKVRFVQIIFGLHFGQHPEEVWRPVLGFAMLAGLFAWLLVPRTPYKVQVGLFTLFGFPFIAYALIQGEWLGLPIAPTNEWGGFLLTFTLASVGMVFALPLGIILALGRRSNLPIIRAISIAYIELWRGAPLITVLFMASVMLPLFFSHEIDLNKVVRAMIGISLFQSAYMAEAVRGGLQAIPRGQYEAADSLGLGYWKKMGLIILPQSLKISIPSIVNTYMTLFKDTSLVAIIGLLDLLNMAQTASRSLEWKGYDFEAYVFAASIYWVCTYSMSRYSQHIERKLDTSKRG